MVKLTLGEQNPLWASDCTRPITCILHQADPNASGPLGYTPLHIAAKANSRDAVPLLLGAGVDPEPLPYPTPLYPALPNLILPYPSVPYQTVPYTTLPYPALP